MNSKNKKAEQSSKFEIFAAAVSKAAGSTPAFIGAFMIVLAWAISGPFFNYSETWQLVINTGTTIITFLMVFLIQKAQNKDSLAIQLKLNELVASSEYASNRLVDIEDMTETEMEVVKKYYQKLSDLSQDQNSLHITHSVDEAADNQKMKNKKSGATSSKIASSDAKKTTAKPAKKK